MTTAYTSAQIAAWLASPNPSPETITQVGSEVALSLIGGPNVAQIFEVFDKFGNPIFTIPTAGGPSVLGDRFSAFRPGDIFNPDFRILTSTADNIQTNVGAVQFGHGTGVQVVYWGTGLPTDAAILTSGTPNNGSWFFRLDGAAGAAIYQRRAGTWTATAA